MPYPKLKYPRLCRILTYVVVLGAAIVPIVVVIQLPVSDLIKVPVVLGILIGLLVYMFRNFAVLMGMDMTLAMLACYQTARTRYTLPQGRTAEQIRRSILHYGKAYPPVSSHLQPSALRYKFSSSWTVYSRGIERVVAAYEIDLLTRENYRQILSSAKANSRALIGKKKPFFLDPAQKNAPLNRVSVVLILAHRVDPQVVTGMHNLVCRACGNEEEDCTLPCVVDLSQRTCVFDGLRVPYIGFSYAVKNRGIRLIKKFVFGGNLNPSGNTAYLREASDVNLDDSLWDLWKQLHHEVVGADRKIKRQFEAMAAKEIRIDDDTLYLKWDQRGIWQSIKLDAEKKTVKVEHITDWYYPEERPIGKRIRQQLAERIQAHFENQGYSVKFVSMEDLLE